MCTHPSQRFSKWFKKNKLQQLILASEKVVRKEVKQIDCVVYDMK